MRIVAVDIFAVTIPFADGGAGIGLTLGRWDKLENIFVRLTSDTGVEGWGEAFSFVCQSAVAAAARDMVAPLVLGARDDDPAAVADMLQRRLDKFGRYGITMFAISGFDIALWDLAAKMKGVSLATLLGGRQRDALDAYASLVRYGQPDLVRGFAAEAVARGYRSVKLHETDLACIAAGRAGAGPDTHLTVDVNCAFDVAATRALLPALAELNVAWLEEPVYPPEDGATLAAIAADSPVALAAGENWCTRHQFRDMMQRRAVTYPQPSVTKVGGVTEFLAVLADADRHGLVCMPHTPYFGPGYFATLQLLSLRRDAALVEYLYVEPAGFPGRDTPRPRDGRIAVPDTAGIGFAPDVDVLETFGSPPIRLRLD